MDHQDHPAGSDEVRLDRLFEAYREACPDFEPDPGFMPRLWQKIEARQGVSLVFGRLARRLATAALGLSFLLGLAVSFSGSHMGPLPSESYAEVVAEEHDSATLDFLEPVRFVPSPDQR